MAENFPAVDRAHGVLRQRREERRISDLRARLHLRDRVKAEKSVLKGSPAPHASPSAPDLDDWASSTRIRAEDLMRDARNHTARVLGVECMLSGETKTMEDWITQLAAAGGNTDSSNQSAAHHGSADVEFGEDADTLQFGDVHIGLDEPLQRGGRVLLLHHQTRESREQQRRAEEVAANAAAVAAAIASEEATTRAQLVATAREDAKSRARATNGALLQANQLEAYLEDDSGEEHQSSAQENNQDQDDNTSGVERMKRFEARMEEALLQQQESKAQLQYDLNGREKLKEDQTQQIDGIGDSRNIESLGDTTRVFQEGIQNATPRSNTQDRNVALTMSQTFDISRDGDGESLDEDIENDSHNNNEASSRTSPLLPPPPPPPLSMPSKDTQKSKQAMGEGSNGIPRYYSSPDVNDRSGSLNATAVSASDVSQRQLQKSNCTSSDQPTSGERVDDFMSQLPPRLPQREPQIEPHLLRQSKQQQQPSVTWSLTTAGSELDNSHHELLLPSQEFARFAAGLGSPAQSSDGKHSSPPNGHGLERPQEASSPLRSAASAAPVQVRSPTAAVRTGPAPVPATLFAQKDSLIYAREFTISNSESHEISDRKGYLEKQQSGLRRAAEDRAVLGLSVSRLSVSAELDEAPPVATGGLGARVRAVVEERQRAERQALRDARECAVKVSGSASKARIETGYSQLAQYSGLDNAEKDANDEDEDDNDASRYRASIERAHLRIAVARWFSWSALRRKRSQRWAARIVASIRPKHQNEDDSENCDSNESMEIRELMRTKAERIRGGIRVHSVYTAQIAAVAAREGRFAAAMLHHRLQLARCCIFRWIAYMSSQFPIPIKGSHIDHERDNTSSDGEDEVLLQPQHQQRPAGIQKLKELDDPVPADIDSFDPSSPHSSIDSPLLEAMAAAASPPREPRAGAQ